jgi:hypothetical protein
MIKHEHEQVLPRIHLIGNDTERTSFVVGRTVESIKLEHDGSSSDAGPSSSECKDPDW